MRLGWSEYSMNVFEAIEHFRTDEYHFNKLNEYAYTIQDNTGATGLVSEPQTASVGTQIDPKGKDRVS